MGLVPFKMFVLVTNFHREVWVGGENVENLGEPWSETQRLDRLNYNYARTFLIFTTNRYCGLDGVLGLGSLKTGSFGMLTSAPM